MITVCTWLWGNKYHPSYAVKLAHGVRRHLRQAHRFVVFTNDHYLVGIETRPILYAHKLLEEKGCFVRLKMFDKAWQTRNEIADRLVCMDLDTVITGPLDDLFDRPEPFLIMQNGDTSDPCPFNGALQMLRIGAYHDVWDDFTLEKAKAIPFYEFPDDRGWIWHKIPDASGWKCGLESGIYVFRKLGWPAGTDELPKGAKLVTFNGKRNPEKFQHLNWVKDNWI